MADKFSTSIIDEVAANVVHNIYNSPLPCSQYMCAPLSSQPDCLDIIQTPFDDWGGYTSWNLCSYSYPCVFGYEIEAKKRARSIQNDERDTPINILSREKLHLATGLISNRLIQSARIGGLFITDSLDVLYELPFSYRFVDTLKPSSIPKHEPQAGSSDQDKSRTSTLTDLEVPSSSDNKNDTLLDRVVTGLDIPELPTHGKTILVPVRTCFVTKGLDIGVRLERHLPVTRRGEVLFEEYRGKPFSQSILRDPFSVLISSTQTGVDFCHDVAPIVRAICFAMPASKDCFKIDKQNIHFIRRATSGKYLNLKTFVKPWPWTPEPELHVVATTFDTYANIVASNDSVFEESWIAVPVTSYTLCIPLLEYIVFHATSELWTGRTTISYETQYEKKDSTNVDGHYCSMPSAHSVYIPGVSKILLVLLVDVGRFQQVMRNREIPIHLNIYHGSSICGIEPYITNIGPIWNRHFTTENFRKVAKNAISVISYFERIRSVDGTFRKALGIAADLCCIVNETLKVNSNINSSQSLVYSNDLCGGWTFGGGGLTQEDTHYSTSDLIGTPLKDQPTLFSNLLTGYNFASLTPSLQANQSGTRVTVENSSDATTWEGFNCYWTNVNPENCTYQYRLTEATSINRVLIDASIIQADECHYNIQDVAALQSTLAMLATAIASSISVFLSTNDKSLHSWVGWNNDELYSCLIEKLFRGTIITNQTQMVLSHMRSAFPSMKRCFDTYYDDSYTSETWAIFTPIPFHLHMQWYEKTIKKFEYKKIKHSMSYIAKRNWPVIQILSTMPSMLCPTAATVDFNLQKPFLIYRSEDSSLPVRFLPYSVDQWHMLSNQGSCHIKMPLILESGVPAISTRSQLGNDNQILIWQGNDFSHSHFFRFSSLIQPDFRPNFL